MVLYESGAAKSSSTSSNAAAAANIQKSGSVQSVPGLTDNLLLDLDEMSEPKFNKFQGPESLSNSMDSVSDEDMRELMRQSRAEFLANQKVDKMDSKMDMASKSDSDQMSVECEEDSSECSSCSEISESDSEGQKNFERCKIRGTYESGIEPVDMGKL